MSLEPRRINDHAFAYYARLLAERNYSITELALLLGFADASHLAKTFRRHRGMTPTDYRRHCTKQGGTDSEVRTGP